MLQYMGSRQPPRKYTVSNDALASSDQNSACDVCQTRVWTKEFFSKLQEAPTGEQSVIQEYGLTSRELRSSILAGCRFCRTLADGIHGKVFLDELYARFQSGNDQPSSAISDDGKSQSSDTSILEQGEKEASDDWNDASAFNEDEIDEDVTGGWDTWEDRDTLLEECEFRVELSFERGEDDFYTFLNASIEAIDEREVSKNNCIEILKGEDLVELRYAIHEDAPHLGHARPFPVQTASAALGSEANLQTISSWVQKRQNLYKGITQDLDHLPARLIRLQENGTLRIVLTSTIHQTQRAFAALSYVWGVNQTFILKSNTIKSLESSFKLENLPQTIQDAVTVTRRAGLRYLWVDALCIIQDSATDKMRELPKMRSIYTQAAITIVTSVARSATDGFLQHITSPAYFIDPLTVSNPTSSPPSNLILSYPAAYKRHHDPINTRAWTFQELILSTRAVLFSYRGIDFIDRTNPPSADGLTSGRDAQLPNLPWNGRLFSLTQAPENIRQTWLAVRGEYTRRNLTYMGDKLLAIAGVAQEIARSYQTRYLAGLWERDLVREVQWRCFPSDNVGRRAKSTVYVAPSWSWACVDGSVDASEFFDDEEAGDEGGEGVKSGMGFEVLSCEVELVDEAFEFGAVKGGKLVVRGMIITLAWRPHRKSLLDVGDTDGCLVALTENDDEVVVGDATVDTLNNGLEEDKVRVACLATRLIEHVPGRDEVEGLMLLPVDDGLWRRVGFFKVDGPKYFDDCKTQEIVIV